MTLPAAIAVVAVAVADVDDDENGDDTIGGLIVSVVAFPFAVVVSSVFVVFFADADADANAVVVFEFEFLNKNSSIRKLRNHCTIKVSPQIIDAIIKYDTPPNDNNTTGITIKIHTNLVNALLSSSLLI